jgi:tetrahydromethanopterin S-methyltransferase subunit B
MSPGLQDVLKEFASAARGIRSAIMPATTLPGRDATGGAVGSLTEAVMGLSAGLVQIASAITDLAEAVREHGQEEN